MVAPVQVDMLRWQRLAGATVILGPAWVRKAFLAGVEEDSPRTFPVESSVYGDAVERGGIAFQRRWRQRHGVVQRSVATRWLETHVGQLD